MIEVRRIETRPGLVFDASVAGDAAAPLVLLLHGFAVSRHLYDARGAGAGAGRLLSPWPRTSAATPLRRGPIRPMRRSTDIEVLIADALDIVAALGHGARRFHLVGHDWGGSLAWEIAGRHPEQLGAR